MADLQDDAFRDDPAIRLTTSGLTAAEAEAYRRQFLHVLFKSAALNGGIFQFAPDDKSCGAIWLPPGKKVDNPITALQAGFLGVIRKLGFKGSKRIMIEFPSLTAARKKAHLVPLTKRYHYLFFLGCATAAQGKGLGGAVLKRTQDRILASGPNASTITLPPGDTPLEFLPIWLESSSLGSKRLYERCGFRQVGEDCILAKGTHHGDGRPVSGEMKGKGEGVRIYPMIWVPEGFRGDDGSVAAAPPVVERSQAVPTQTAPAAATPVVAAPVAS
jgi:hypothetical protein